MGTIVLVLIASLPIIIFVPSDAIAECSIPNSPANTTFIHTDHVGSTSLLTNEVGGVTESIRYSPYGEIRGRWNALNQPITESSQESRLRAPIRFPSSLYLT